jgi:hypothetical protein
MDTQASRRESIIQNTERPHGLTSPDVYEVWPAHPPTTPQSTPIGRRLHEHRHDKRRHDRHSPPSR